MKALLAPEKSEKKAEESDEDFADVDIEAVGKEMAEADEEE